MAGVRLEDMTSGKALYNGAEHSIVEVMVGGEVVWPAALSYVLSNVQVRYSAGSVIFASGQNYAYITATVTTTRGATVISVEDNVVLTPVKVSGSLYVSGNYIRGGNLGTTVTSAASGSFAGTYQELTTSAFTVNQEANVVTSTEASAIVSVSADPSPVPAAGAQVNCYGSITRSVITYYTSGENTTTSDHEGAMSVYVDSALIGTCTHGGSVAYTIGNNKTTGYKTYNVVLQYGEESDSMTLTQNPGIRVYSAPVISAQSIPDIPASGGTAYPSGTVVQSWNWNGVGIEGYVSGLSVTWSTPSFTGEHLHTTVKSRTLLGQTVGTCESYGMTADPVTVTCYQQANARTISSSPRILSIAATDESTVSALGETREVVVNSYQQYNYEYTSGDTSYARVNIASSLVASHGQILETASGPDVHVNWRIPGNLSPDMRIVRVTMSTRLGETRTLALEQNHA